MNNFSVYDVRCQPGDSAFLIDDSVTSVLYDTGFGFTGFKVADVYETKVCPLAKVMRKELKAVGIESLKVVYSEEEPKTKVSDRIIPSISFVPSTAGLIIAGEVIKDLIGIKNAK